MALDDLVDSEKKKTRYTSNKSAENISVQERSWKEILAHHPMSLYIVAIEADDSDTKCLLSIIDDVLEDGVRGHNLSDGQIEEIEYARSEIIEMTDF